MVHKNNARAAGRAMAAALAALAALFDLSGSGR
jgi:hypothetical protein